MRIRNIENDSIGQIYNEKQSLSYQVKHLLLQGFNEAQKNTKKNLRTMGSEHFKRQLLDSIIPSVYKKAAKAPVDENKIVFVEVRLPYITNSFEVIFDELVNNYDYTVHTHFLRNNQCIRREYTQRCINAVEDIATARYVFVNEASNVLSAIPLRKETKIIQLWHGCGAFKKFGLSTADLIFGESRKQQLRHPFYKNYSLVTVSSPEVVWAYNEAMNIDEASDIVQPTGISRTDIFYDSEFIDSCYDKLYDVMPQAKGKKVILYAPTFRGRVAKAKTPDMLNIQMFYENLGEDYVLLFKHHPLVKSPPVIPEEYSNFAVNMGEAMGIEELLSVSDICISDYSSLVFEYSLFEKPIIFFAYDLDEYFDWRGFYYDYFELAPGPVVKTNFEMIDYIKNIDERFDKKAVQDFRYKFMRSCDGHATQRILEAMLDDLQSHRKPCEKFEKYHTVPYDEGAYFPYFRLVEGVKENHLKAAPIYEEYSKRTASGSVIALDISSVDIMNLLIKNRGTSRVRFLSTRTDDIEYVAKELAGARTIIIDHVNRLLDSLEIREETNVILLVPDAFPLEAFGVDTMAYRSGLKKELYNIAPLFSSVKTIIAPSEKTGEIFSKTINSDADIKPIGNVASDLLFDEEFKTKTLEKLYEAYPQLEGRKIISYMPLSKDEIDDSIVYEYLCKDYVFLKKICDEKQGGENYYSDTIVNVDELLTEYELLAISDIVVGNFKSETLSFLATLKPVIQFCKSPEKELSGFDCFVDPAAVSPTQMLDSTRAVVDMILDIDNYDYEKYNSIRAEYLEKCDGKSTQRLFALLNDMEA